MVSLLDQALSTTQRKAFLRNLSKSQFAELQRQIDARRGSPREATKTAAKLPTTRTDDSLDHLRSGSLIGTQRVVRIGRHRKLISTATRYVRVRDTVAYFYLRGMIWGYAARGDKLIRLKLDAATKRNIAETIFHIQPPPKRRR